MKEETIKEPVKRLLRIEHISVARSLGFTSEKSEPISDELIMDLVGEIDQRSRNKDDFSARIVVTVCALLWTHCVERRDALIEMMILMLSRIGFSVSGMMVDGGYDDSTGEHSPIQSWLTKCAVASYQIASEVRVGDQIVLLSAPQKRIWDKLSGSAVLGISAPTSAGKSFVITLKSIELLLEKRGVIVYIVPTLSLVSQVTIDFQEQLRNFGLSDFTVSTTYSSDRFNPDTIYVFTQEKALAAFSQSDTPFPNLRMLVVDEIQNIERVAQDSDQRAKRLYDVILEFKHTSVIDHIVISGPRITGLGELGHEIFGVESESESVSSSPVAGLTYAIFQRKKHNFLFRQFSDLLDQPTEIIVTGAHNFDWFGKALYSEKYHSFLTKFVEDLGKNAINIVFAPTASQARKTALNAFIEEPRIANDNLKSLIEYLSETVHPAYDLCEALAGGVAYHHGKVPPHARRAVEYAISKKMISKIVCTTTLMQGVNLPAQNIVIRTPKLFVRKSGGDSPVLTNYEIANLRGRAGRLFKDLLGRAFILEENSFTDDEDPQEELFKDEHKELVSGYGGVYNDFRAAVEEQLTERIPPTPESTAYAYISTYIRQTILKHGHRAEERLRAVGIFLDPLLRQNVEATLSELSVPQAVCFANRYWDPLDLDELYRDRNTFKLVTKHTGSNVARELKNLLIYMRDRFPIYCGRYCKVPTKDSTVLSMGIAASNWMKEVPLSKLLTDGWYDSSDKIELGIERFHNEISYGIPGLLKPLYDIKDPSSMILRFIECGAYKPRTRYLIEENIPRETAIRIATLLPNSADESIRVNGGKDILLAIRPQLNFWDQVQMRGILPQMSSKERK